MATIKFHLIGNNIYSDFTISRDKKFRSKTGYTTKADHWKTIRSTRPTKEGKYLRKADLENPSDADAKILKSKLDILQDAILKQYNHDYSKGLDINSDWFKSSIEKHTNQETKDKDLLTYQIQKAIDNGPRKKIKGSGGTYKIGISEGRIKNIRLFKNIILRFEDEVYQGSKIKIPNITKEIIKDFEDWMFAQKYSHNYIGKHLSNFKSILNDLEDVELNINITKDIQIITEEKQPEDIIYLSFEELERIKDLKLTNNYLSNARKWLILGCYIGQRASDLLELTPDKIKVIRGRKVFHIKQKKTGQNVTIPILPEAEAIIKTGFPHKISDTKLREYFKQLCKIAEINDPTNGRIKKSKHGTTIKGVYPKWRLIGTHVCRRSFASNYYGTIPTVVLKGITGHSTEKMFLKYIGKTDEDFAMQMFDYMDKLPEVKTMKVIKNEPKTGTNNI